MVVEFLQGVKERNDARGHDGKTAAPDPAWEGDGACRCGPRRAGGGGRRLLDRLGAGGEIEARLVAAGGALAGFEIRLAPGAITYWRDPGDAASRQASTFRARAMSLKSHRRFRRRSDLGGGRQRGLRLREGRRHPAQSQAARSSEASYVGAPRQLRGLRAAVPAGEGQADADAGRRSSPYAPDVEAALAAVPRPVAPEAFGALER